MLHDNNFHNNFFYFFLFQFSFLPPAEEVWGKVLFLYLFICSQGTNGMVSPPVWLPGVMFLLGGSLSRGSMSDPLYGEGRVVPILLECSLVLSVFSGCKLFDLPCKAIQFCLKVKVRLLLEFNLVGGCRFH